METINKLVFGKNEQESIVGMEIHDDVADLFVQDKQGQISIVQVPNRFWLLTKEPKGYGWIKLKGDLPYKFGKQFKQWDQYAALRSKLGDSVFGIWDKSESLMVKDGYTFFKGLKVKDVSVLSFDLETNGAEITADSKVLLISNTFRNSKGEITKKLFSFDDYEGQGQLIEAWCSWVREMDPSVLCGHNIYGFDIPFLDAVSSMNNVTLDLGRDGSKLYIANKESRFRKDGSQTIGYKKVRCYGRSLIDTMFLAIKYDVGRKYENYKLKDIIKYEGLEKKNRVFYDASLIRKNYTNPEEWKKIKEYAIDDADDSLALYDLMIPTIFYATQSVPKSFQSMLESATGSQINAMMMRSYLQDGHSLPQADESIGYEGAISFGHPGIYKNVFKVDVASLYPSCILEFEVYDNEKDPDGNFLKIIKYFTSERLRNKKLAKDTQDNYYEDLQQSMKIFINSGYGFLGASGLLFNSPHAAAFITEKGREVLQTAIKWAESKNFNIPNADTDSISICKKNGDTIDEKERVELLNELNSLYPSQIKFEDDGFYPKMIISKAKNYILWDGKKIKIKGSALKSSTRPAALKEFMSKIIDSILHDKNDYKDIYMSYVREINSVKDIQRWATKKTLTDRVMESERSNESKVRDALDNSEYKEGDKFYVFYKSDDSLCLVENFSGDYNKKRLFKNLFDCSKVFEELIDFSLFKNYSLKKAEKELHHDLFSEVVQDVINN